MCIWTKYVNKSSIERWSKRYIQRLSEKERIR